MPYVNIDMDGVLVDLVGGVNRSYRHSRPLELKGDYDLNKIFNFDAMNKIENATSTFWANLPREPWASDLVECILDRFLPSQIRVLTKYVSPACAAGKIVWMKYNYPRIAEQIVLVSNDKEFACNPNDILIDDYAKNTSAWRARGGYAITVPQPWNIVSGDPMTHIERELNLYRDTGHG